MHGPYNNTASQDWSVRWVNRGFLPRPSRGGRPPCSASRHAPHLLPFLFILVSYRYAWLNCYTLIMGVQTTSGPRRLKGLHGVHISLYSPFKNKSYPHHDICETDYKVPGILGENQEAVIRSHLWQRLPAFMKPTSIHCNCHGDQTIPETFANVLTSLPFIVVGLQTPRKNLRSATYGTSLIGVGIASSLYHCSRGNMRKILRWVDYTMIAAATVCLSRALRNENSRLLMVASAFCLPFKPFLVSLVHTGLMEVSFAQRASVKPELKMSHNLHAMSSLLGGALFFADDCYPETPYIHAAWHLAAAVGAGTCNKLLECDEP